MLKFASKLEHETDQTRKETAVRFADKYFLVRDIAVMF